MTWHVICYSGGEASGLVAIEVVRRYGTEKMILLNHDITPYVEDLDIKRFKGELAAALNLPITYANMEGWENKDQLDVCVEAKAFKVGIHPLCTNRLKTAPFHEWLQRAFPVDPVSKQNDDVIIYYGFESGETERIKRRRDILGKKGYQTQYPLAEWPRTIQSTRDIGIEPPSTYQVWKHANCTGCLRAGRQHWYVVYCRRPDIYEKAKRAESAIGYSIIKGIHLHELEIRFRQMQEAGIKADEKMNAATFWAMARRLLDVSREEDETAGKCSTDHLEYIEKIS